MSEIHELGWWVLGANFLILGWAHVIVQIRKNKLTAELVEAIQWHAKMTDNIADRIGEYTEQTYNVVRG